MRKVFWDDPYLYSLDTRVATVEDRVITLEETIFYAFSGGQESDRGEIAGLPVVEARAAGALIEYELAGDHGLRPGDAVSSRIDEDRRDRLRRLHSAAEIALQLVYRLAGDARKTGAHISPEKARLDFALTGVVSRLLPAIADGLAEVVAADLPIECGFADGSGERRYWRVHGFDEVPCCGTHPRRTGEIGALRLRRVNPGKGLERVEILL